MKKNSISHPTSSAQLEISPVYMQDSAGFHEPCYFCPFYRSECFTDLIFVWETNATYKTLTIYRNMGGSCRKWKKIEGKKFSTSQKAARKKFRNIEHYIPLDLGPAFSRRMFWKFSILSDEKESRRNLLIW